MKPGPRRPLLDEVDALTRKRLQWRARRELLRRSFADFVRTFWPVVEPEAPILWGWHVDALCLHLQACAEGRIRRLIIEIPPGHAKSLITAVLFPAWMWARRPGWRGLFASYARNLAIRDSVKCRRLVRSQAYLETFAPDWRLAGDQDVKSYFENSASGFRLALGVKGEGTGYRGDAIIVDDSLSAAEAESKAKRERVARWYDKTFSSRLNDKRVGIMIVQGQRLHRRDLAGHLKDKGGRWCVLSLATEYDPDHPCITHTDDGEEFWRDPRAAAGELLFPALFPADVVEEIKRELGPRGYRAQHLQSPSSEDGDLWRREWWSKYATIPTEIDEWLQSWDFAFKDKASSDYVSGTLWARVGALRYLVDEVHARLDFNGCIRRMIELTGDAEDPRRHTGVYPWNLASAVLVEDKANGTAIMNALERKISGLIPINPRSSKYARAAACQPQIAAGQVYLPANVEWLDAFVTECADFPTAPHDDRVDSVSQALAYMSEHGGAIMIGRVR